MTPEQRELLESRKWYRTTPVDEAIRAALARLDAAEYETERLRAQLTAERAQAQAERERRIIAETTQRNLHAEINQERERREAAERMLAEAELAYDYDDPRIVTALAETEKP